MKKYTKLISYLLAAVIIVSSFTVFSFAESLTYENFTYETNNGKVTITGYTGTAEKIVVPGVIDSNPVTAIKKEAFKENKTVKSIELPNTVTSIGSKAFALCDKLSSVIFSENVNSIGISAFYGTALYEASTGKDGATYINNCLIHVKKTVDGKEITSYEIKDGTRLIAQGAFYLDSLTYTSAEELVYPALKSISIPSSVKRINSFSFYGCNMLTQLIINEGVEYIDKNAFEKCSSLTNVILPPTLVKLNSNVFNSCDSLTEVTVTGNPQLSEGAFNECPSLKSVTFSENLKSFNFNVFKNCKALVSVTLPASVTKFEEGTAVGCDSLKTIKGYTGSAAEAYAKENGFSFTSIGESPLVFDYEINESDEITITAAYGANDSVLEIPEVYDEYTVKSVGNGAFKDNSDIVDLFLADSITVSDGAFSNCEKLRTVVLGNENVIGKSFTGCNNIKAVIIPESVNNIAVNCFAPDADITIYGYTGSFAELYANENYYSFADITVASAPECYWDMLTAETEKLESLKLENYTEESVTALKAEINNLKALKDAGTATVIEIEKAITEAEKAYNQMSFIIFEGDTNRDGKLSIVDAKWVLQFIANTRTLEEDAKTAADINKDGKISVVDAKWILQVLAGIRDTQDIC